MAKHCPKRYTTSEQKTIIEKLIDLEIIISDKSRIFLNESFRFYFFHEAIKKELINNHHTFLERELPVIIERQFYYKEISSHALFFHLAVAGAQNDTAKIEHLCNTASDFNDNIFNKVAQELLRFFDLYFGIHKFPVKVLDYTIDSLLFDSMRDFQKAEIVKSYSEIISSQIDGFTRINEVSCCDLIMFHILRGEFESANLIANQLSNNVTEFYQNTINFIQGKSPIDEVIATYEQIFKNWLGGISKYKLYSWLFFFYPLAALVQQSNSPETAKVLKKLMTKNSRMDSITEQAKAVFRKLFKLKNSEYTDLNPFYTRELYKWDDDIINFFKWCGLTLLQRQFSSTLPNILTEKTLLKLKKYYEQTEFYYIESELSHIIEAYNQKKIISKSPINKITEVGLVNHVQKIETWEKILSLLENDFLPAKQATSNSQPTPSGKRLVWIIEYSSPENYTIIPKEQTLSKSGKWTKGRKIAVKRFIEQEVESAEEKDYQIATQAIEKVSNGWYSNQSYYYDDTKLAVALIGAENLYVEEKGNLIQTEFKTAELELKIVTEGDQLKLSISPFFEFKNTYLMRETITTHRVYNVKEETASLAKRITNKGITLPKSQESRITALIPNLSKNVSVSTDATDPNNQEFPVIELAPELKIRLFPFNNGIRIETIVGPYSDKARTFHPGQGTSHFFATNEGEHSQFIRNLTEEKKLYDQLLQRCPTLEQFDDGSFSWFIDELEPSLEIVSELGTIKEDYTIEWPEGEKLPFASAINFDNLQLRVKSDNDWFELEGEVKVNDQKLLSAKELIQPTEQHGRFIKMSDGRFIALSKKLHKELERARSLVQADKKVMRLHPSSPLNFDGFLKATNAEVDNEWEERVANIRKVKNKRYNTPAGLNADLRDYQVDGFKWLSQLSDLGFGACLADDMGLGKTIQALTLLLKRKAKGPTLVVAPASVCENWQREVTKFTPALNPIIFSESENRERAIKKAKKGDLVIVTYGLLNSSGELFQSKKWGTVILDEAQMIKNHQAKRTKAAHALNADFKMITTGTPIENNLLELWSLFEFINPGLLGNKRAFFNSYSKSIEIDHNRSSMKQLKELVKPFILRRKKMDVLDDLPPKTEIPLHIEMTQNELGIYEALRDKAVTEMAESTDNVQFLILAHLTKLRRACCHTSLATKKKKGESSKLNQLIELMEELKAGGHKVLIFSQFVDFLKLAAEQLDNNKFSYQYLDGSTPVKKRLKLVDKFQNGEGDAFLISLKAGGTGLNLTAADYVIHLDPWWNPASEDQASDRAHRIGQQRPVTVYRFITKGTVEEKISKLHHEKRELSESLLSGAEVSSKMSVEEIINLLK